MHVIAWLSSKRIDAERKQASPIFQPSMVYLDTVAGNGREIYHTFIDPMGSIFVLSLAWPTHPTATTGWGPHDHNTSLRWRFAPSRLMQTLFKSIRPLGRPWELKQDIYNPGQWRAVEPPKITKFYPKIIWTKPSLLCSMLIFRSVSMDMYGIVLWCWFVPSLSEHWYGLVDSTTFHWHFTIHIRTASMYGILPYVYHWKINQM